MEASTQAFSLLLAADVLVGYHSSDGWITAVNLVLAHYGLPENEELTSLFVATVPVALDVTFKYWAFKYVPPSSIDLKSKYVSWFHQLFPLLRASSLGRRGDRCNHHLFCTIKHKRWQRQSTVFQLIGPGITDSHITARIFIFKSITGTMCRLTE